MLITTVGLLIHLNPSEATLARDSLQANLIDSPFLRPSPQMAPDCVKRTLKSLTVAYMPSPMTFLRLIMEERC